MMTFRDELQRARESAAPVFHDFLKRSAKGQSTVHVFFEGPDDFSFYTSFLQQYVEQFEPYECKSKKAVLDARTKVMPRIQAPTVALFFVDKDLSDIIGEEISGGGNVYTTDFYAIENYIVSDRVLRRVWNEFFRFSNVIVDFEDYRLHFLSALDRFHKLMQPISAWIVYAMTHGLRPMIDNVKLDRIISINQELEIVYSDQVQRDGLYNTLSSMCRIEHSDDYIDEIERIADSLASRNPKNYIRGKFEMWFFVKFINTSLPILTAQAERMGGSFSPRLSLTDKHAVMLLGPRVHPIPSSLERFLSLNLRS